LYGDKWMRNLLLGMVVDWRHYDKF
jgi:hypothetical protein